MNENKFKVMMFKALLDNDLLKMKKKDIINKISDISKYIDNKWKESNYTCFDVYNEPYYLYSTANCYITTTSNSIKNAIIYFKENNIDYKNLKWFDDYNGAGFTTLDILENGVKDICFFNDCKYQLKAFARILEKFNYEYPLLDINRQYKYDVVCSFEIAEHEKNPIEYIDKILNMVNDNGYLLYSHTFAETDYFGHFNEYIINGKKMSRRSTARYIMKYIKSKGFKLEKRCFNQKPYIFKKISN